MAQLNVTSVPWIDSGDAPPLALDRDKRDIIGMQSAQSSHLAKPPRNNSVSSASVGAT